jgi:septal ring factor EnvC (AmiA/AmiB activator)
MEGHYSRLEQAKDRISELDDKMKIQGKTEELLIKQLKTFERNMHELTNTIKKTKPENHGHWRRRRGTSKRDS